MAIFSKLVTTEKGLALIARMLSSENKIVFTKVCTSDAEYTLEELESLEELTGIKQTSSVSKISRTSDIAVKVETVFTNTELTEGYYMRTVALYAQDGEGGEILYAAAVETSGNCYMPAFGGITVSGAYIQLVTTVSNAENVTIEVDNSVFATIGNIMELQQQIDTVRDLAGSMTSAINTNAAKLDCLDRIGQRVYTKEIHLGQEIENEVTINVCEILQDEFSALNNKTYYLYVLDMEPGKVVSMHMLNEDGSANYQKDMSGVMDIGMGFQTSAGHEVEQSAPIARYLKIFHTVPIFLFSIDGPPISGMYIFMRPLLYEKDESGDLIITSGKIKLNMSLRLRIFKLGYVLANIEGSGTVEGGGSSGTSDYNMLVNKPSVNNVVLQGNLTSEQLGLEGGAGGGATEMTYEETIAALNEEEETSNE